MRIGESFTATDYLQAQKIRTRLMKHLTRAFKVCDVIATPTTPVTAPVIRWGLAPYASLQCLLFHHDEQQASAITDADALCTFE